MFSEKRIVDGEKGVLLASAIACIITLFLQILNGMYWAESLIKEAQAFLIMSTIGVLYYSNKISSVFLMLFPLVAIEVSINMGGLGIIPPEILWTLTSGGLMGIMSRSIDEKIKALEATKTP